MKKVNVLKELADEYQNVEESLPFSQIKEIRDNFVHNKSSSYYGVNVRKNENATEYVSYNSKGISAESIYKATCKLMELYGELCIKVNAFIKARIESYEQEEFEV